MPERSLRRWSEPLRWGCLGLAVVTLVVFLLAQRQSVDASYGTAPASAGASAPPADDQSEVGIPSVAEMTALVARDPVVRLPGSVATWDTERVRAAIGDQEVRILVAPPGLSEEERRRIQEVRNATVRVVGTQVTGSIYRVSGDTLPTWRAQFGAFDVTSMLTTLIATLAEQPEPPEHDGWRWREPTTSELATVATDLRTERWHRGPGATLTEVPQALAADAFPDGGGLFVALGPQRLDRPVPQYGPALTRLFPDTPIVVLYGSWVEYHGPHAANFAEVVAATFYAQLGDRLSRLDYPQRNVLGAYLARVVDVRYAGLFDRPLPYQPVDPLRVALPALPWVFAASVMVFLALSVRSLRAPGGAAGDRAAGGGVPPRMAGLTALAIEMSLLTDRRSDAALTRGITVLQAARAALAEQLPARHVGTLLDEAETELDEAARTLGIAGYRPAAYLQGRLS